MASRVTPREWFYRWALRANRAYHTRLHRAYNPDGIGIFTEDWDTLVILDACRYDDLEEHNILPGRLESRRSRGSATYEFLMANFQDRNLTDTVYVTATLQIHRFADEINVTFYDAIEISSTDGLKTDGNVYSKTIKREIDVSKSGFREAELVRVLWLIYEHGKRPDIISERPVHERPDVEWNVVGDGLQNLGYTD